jgi:TolB-like protein
VIGAVLLLVPTVAVMPFKDLSGGKGSVGEAIRETVTSDLKDVGGLKVVERGNIDKIIAEQNLQAHKNDLGMAESIRVGTLLGATLIVAGSYQKASSQVRLIARFVDVATGEVKGSAKVDGSTGEFLSLQDKITSKLLQSAGMEPQKVQKFAVRVRPKVKSFKAIELYGDAVVEPDDKKKEQLLKLSLNEDPQFSYASADLAALEQRIKHYSAVADEAGLAADRDIKQKIAGEKDPAKQLILYTQLMMNYAQQRRFRHSLATARAILALPPSTPQYENYSQGAWTMMFSALETYHQWDDVMREGEKFMAKYPGSPMFMMTQNRVQHAIEEKRQIAEGLQTAEGEIAKLPNPSDPCRRGVLYTSHKNPEKGLPELKRCLAGGADNHPPMPPGFYTFQAAISCRDTGDFPGVQRYLEQLQPLNAELYRQLKSFAIWFPVE